jgi:iron(III) transport system permease protein
MTTTETRPERRLDAFRSGLRDSGGPFQAISVIVAVVVALLILYPLGRVLIRLFWVDGSFNLDAFTNVLELPGLGKLLLNTVFVVAAGGGIALILGSVLAWFNERTDARIGAFTDTLPMIPFILPVIAGAIGWVMLAAPRAGMLNYWIRQALSVVGINLEEGPFDIFSWWGLIFVYALYLVPYPYLLVSAGLRNLDPSLEEQSRVCGAGLFRTLFRVTIPNVWQNIAGAALLVATIGFAMISVPIIIGTGARIDVVSVRIVRLLSFSFPAKTAEAVGLSMFVLVALLLIWRLQARLIKGGRFATVGGKSARGRRIELGFWKWPARILIFGYVALALVLPVVGLMLTTLNGFWTANVNWGSLDLDAFRFILFENRTIRASINNSVLLGVVGATIGITISAIISTWIQRKQTKFSTFIDGVVKLPAAISGLILAVGYILAFAGPPFRLSGSLLILLLAFLATHMPNGSISADAAAAQVGTELLEASDVSGASYWRTFRRVSLPVMLPGLVAGWALLFVRYAGDIQAAALLSSTRNTVVGYKILELQENGTWATLAALAMMLTVITAVVVVGVFLITRRRTTFRSTT